MPRSPLSPPPSIVWTVERWAPGIYREFFVALVGALQATPVGISSYWRDRGHNQEVGGKRDSQHLIGLGIDLVLPHNQMNQAANALRARGLIVVDEGTHLHAQAWPPGLARRAGLLDALGF